MGTRRKRHTSRVRTNQHVPIPAEPLPSVIETPHARPALIDRILTKINRLAHWQVAVILILVGLCVFSTGLTNPFQGDDFTQIVNNVPVHSISHVLILFEGGNVYAGHGLAPLSGTYYRPLMMVIFSMLYTLFGPHTLPYHLVQILIIIASTILLYLVFERLFRPLFALTLTLIFLVHPMNSQVAFAIPTLQDALYFFFGILSFYLLISIDEKMHILERRLWLVVACLFLSLLSKEAGGLFIVVDALYLYLTNRYYLKKFLLFLIVPVLIYLALKVHAVGLSGHSNLAPLDKMELGARLLTVPSIMLFYLVKFVFPLKLASGYFWAYSSFSVQHTALPLAIDAVVVGLAVYLARAVKRRGSLQNYRNFVFFSIWAGLGIVVFLQLVPMDFTASETWFYFGMVGILGMAGVLLVTFQKYLRPSVFVSIAVVIICLLGVRTILRGAEWSSEYNLATHDLMASKEDYDAMVNLSNYYFYKREYSDAVRYSLAATRVMPTGVNYGNLAVDLQHQGRYAASYNDYLRSLDYGDVGNAAYENFASLLIVYGKYSTNMQIFEKLIKTYPEDPKLWTYLAIFSELHGNYSAAKAAIIQASHYGKVPQNLYNTIMTDGSL